MNLGLKLSKKPKFASKIKFIYRWFFFDIICKIFFKKDLKIWSKNMDLKENSLKVLKNRKISEYSKQNFLASLENFFDDAQMQEFRKICEIKDQK